MEVVKLRERQNQEGEQKQPRLISSKLVLVVGQTANNELRCTLGEQQSVRGEYPRNQAVAHASSQPNPCAVGFLDGDAFSQAEVHDQDGANEDQGQNEPDQKRGNVQQDKQLLQVVARLRERREETDQHRSSRHQHRPISGPQRPPLFQQQARQNRVEDQAAGLKRAQQRQRQRGDLNRAADDVRDEEEEHADLPSSPSVCRPSNAFVLFFVFEHVRFAL